MMTERLLHPWKIRLFFSKHMIKSVVRGYDYVKCYKSCAGSIAEKTFTA